ncbi:hypothetical protein WDU94_010429 [Cyamophila willieti]
MQLPSPPDCRVAQTARVNYKPFQQIFYPNDYSIPGLGSGHLGNLRPSSESARQTKLKVSFSPSTSRVSASLALLFTKKMPYLRIEPTTHVGEHYIPVSTTCTACELASK